MTKKKKTGRRMGRPRGIGQCQPQPTLFHARNKTLRGIAAAINLIVDRLEAVYRSKDDFDLAGSFVINAVEEIGVTKLVVRPAFALPPGKRLESFDVRCRDGARFIVIPVMEKDSEACGD